MKSSIENTSDVIINSKELVQVLINIINNSKDVLISNNISEPHINLNTKKDNEYVIIEIYDNAGGIKEDIIHKIFEPYFSTKKKLNGTGIGLYISKLIVEQHLNGFISVSNKDGGASFMIKIPIV